MKTILYIITIYLFLDIAGFLAWSLSGQLPVDNFYLGSLSANLLRLWI